MVASPLRRRVERHPVLSMASLISQYARSEDICIAVTEKEGMPSWALSGISGY